MDGFDRSCARGLVAKAFVHEDHVIVDCLGYSNDCKWEISASCLFGDCQGSALAPIAADHKENVYFKFGEPLYHAHRVLGSSGCADVGPAESVNTRHRVRREVDDAVTVFGIQSLVAIRDAQDPAHTVTVVSLDDDRSNHIVQPGANPTARNNGANGGAGVEENFFPWPGDFEARQSAPGVDHLLHNLARVIDEDPVVVVVERVRDSGFPEKWLQWRFDAPFAQRPNNKLFLI